MALVQRPLRGSRISTFYPVKNLPSLSSLDSAFQLQEYISLLIRLDVHDVDAIVSIPGRASAKQKEKETDAGEDGKDKSVNVDEACWKYEQLRRLAQDLSHPLITMLQQVCTRTTCPEMKAGEWLYLCVAHGNDGAMECNSPPQLPARISFQTPNPPRLPPPLHLPRAPPRPHLRPRLLPPREEFEQAEAESSLYARFLALTEKFDLVPADFLVIPPRAVASSGAGDDAGRRGSVLPAPGVDVPPPTLLGAALHVDTTTSSSGSGASPSVAEGEQQQSVSPPGLEGTSAAAGASVGADTTTARRYGRSRTDTMMLEGEGRFPPSPASAAADDGGLDAVLAAAGVGMLPPPSSAHESAAPTPESESAHAPPEEEQEPPSPTSDDEAALGSGTGEMGGEGGEMGPVVSPSSSTAPQAESHPIMSMLEREDSGPVPTIEVVPATPPAVDEEREQRDEEVGAEADENMKEKEGGVKEDEGDVKEEATESAPEPAEPEPAKESEVTATKEQETEAATPLPALAEPPSTETAAPAATADEAEEVDVTDTQKDAEMVPQAPKTETETEPKTETEAEKTETAGEKAD
ncbi:hypothetical protein B0H12DRAFT_1241700 [Mycena haematopus]|nr:hypothetical protein B0H12DRAFT_1241700 [Mycena haematopus]